MSTKTKCFNHENCGNDSTHGMETQHAKLEVCDFCTGKAQTELAEWIRVEPGTKPAKKKTTSKKKAAGKKKAATKKKKK